MVNNEIQDCTAEGDLEKAAELSMANQGVEKQLEQEEEKSKEGRPFLVHEAVTDEEIARIISRWTGIRLQS